MLRVIVRGYGDGNQIFEDRLDVADADIAKVIGAKATEHCNQLGAFALHMVEFEFPDLPMSDRFLRFGSDPRYMVNPVEVRL